MTVDEALAEPRRTRVLAADLVSPIDLPPFDNSQMDGYAVRTADLDGRGDAGVELRVGPPVPAGRTGDALEPGTAAPIMTGAPLPPGADAVVPVEEASPAAFVESGGRVALPAAPQPGRFVRTRGSDLAAGDLLLAARTPLGPAQWGVIAAAGLTAVEVLAPLDVLLVSTGLELAEPGADLAPGRIHDANGVSLALALGRAGARVTAVRLGNDEPDAFLALLGAHPSADLVVTTGGVSAGAYEVVREALGPRGVDFHGVAMQPGGPQGVGTAELPGGRRVAVVAFPGNPVSALVSFELFLREPLRARAGLVPAARPRRAARLAEDVESPPLHQVRRGRLSADDGDGGGVVELVGGPSSHLLHAYARADALVHLPPRLTRAPAGTEVEVQPLDDP